MTDIKIIRIKKTFSSKKSEDPWRGYVFTSATEGGKTIDELVYFCRPGDVKLKEGGFYRGDIKQTKDKDKSDRFERVTAIDGFGEADNPFTETMGENEGEDRDAYFEAFGHLHTAAPIVAKFIKNFNEHTFHKDMKKYLVEFALTCREAHKELTDTLIKEKQK